MSLLMSQDKNKRLSTHCASAICMIYQYAFLFNFDKKIKQEKK